MGLLIDWRKNEVLRGYYEEARVEGRMAGRVEGLEAGVGKGREEGRERLGQILKVMLSQAFGPLPRWADQRIIAAKQEQLQAWCANVIGAKSLAGVIGPRG